MLNLNRVRWPYREDLVFSILSLIVFVVPLAFALFINENFETIKYVLWLVCFGCILLVWLYKKAGSLKEPKSFSITTNGVIAGMLGGIFVWSLLSSILAPDKWYSFFGFYYRFTDSFVFFTLWALTLIILYDILDSERAKFLLKILCIDALLVAIKAILEGFGLTLYLGQSPDAFFFRDAPSFLGNPNFSAMFMAVLVPIIGAIGWQSKKFSSKIFYLVSLLVVLFSLVMLTSRGALLALLVGLLCLIVWLSVKYWGKFSLVKFGLPIVLLLPIFFLIALVSRPGFWQLKIRQDDNIQYRLIVWQQSFEGIFKHPLFGVGLGNFALFQERLPRPVAMGTFDDPHNLWIFLAVSGGIPLLIFFGGLVVYAFYKGYKQVLKSGDLFLASVLTALIIFVVSAAFTPVPVSCYLLLLVLVAALITETRADKLKVNISKLSFIILQLIAIGFILVGLFLGLGETALHYGYGAYMDQDLSTAQKWLKLAELVNPSNVLSRNYYIFAEADDHANFNLLQEQIESLKTIHPTQARTYAFSSDDYFHLFALSKNTSYLDRAIADEKQSLQIDPTFPERYGQLGLEYFIATDYTNSLINLKQSLSLEPTLLPSLILEAEIYQQQNDRPDMLTALENAYLTNVTDPKLKLLWFSARQDPNIKDVPFRVLYSQ